MFAQGSILTHRTANPPQRPLGPEDYYKLGGLFLFDLLIRNTDRFPSRKAFPRPGHCSVEDSGNPGNIMFGPEPGMVWSIDKEMVISVDSDILDSYMNAVASIAKEILFDRAADPKVQSLVDMWAMPWSALVGQADLSLEASRDWSRSKGEVQSMRHSQLNLLRMRIEFCRETAAAARRMGLGRAEGVTNAAFVARSNSAPQLSTTTETDEPDENDAENFGGIECAPMSDDEGQWRAWARASLPTAIADVLTFIQVHTGYTTPAFAMQSFREGFIAAMLNACKFYRDVTSDPTVLISRYPKLGIALLQDPESVHLPFIRHMCLLLQDILNHAVANFPQVFPPTLKESVLVFTASQPGPRSSPSSRKLKDMIRKSMRMKTNRPMEAGGALV